MDYRDPKDPRDRQHTASSVTASVIPTPGNVDNTPECSRGKAPRSGSDQVSKVKCKTSSKAEVPDKPGFRRLERNGRE